MGRFLHCAHSDPAAGVDLGFDILVRGRDRLSTLAMFTRSPSQHYNSIGVGVAWEVLVMRSIGIALALVAVATSSARAEGPIVINANLGINVPMVAPELTCYPDPDSKYRTVFNLDVAYRFIDELAAGVHFGTRRYPWDACARDSSGPYQSYRGIDTAIERSSAQFSVRRFWFTPWLGIENVDAGSGGQHTAWGLGMGVDLYVHPSGHRVGVYVDLTNIEGDPYRNNSEQHLSAGVAYRYW